MSTKSADRISKPTKRDQIPATITTSKLKGRFGDFGPVIGVIATVLIVTIFISGSGSWLDTSMTMATFAIIAVSLSIAYGLGGMLSLAQATFAALGAYATAILTTNWGISPWISVLLAMAVPAVLSYVLARLIVRLSPLALALATLAFSQLVALALNEGGDLTGGYVGITGIPSLNPLNSSLSLHLFGWALVVLAMLILIRLRASNRGRALLTISTDATLAKSIGIPVNRHLSSAFALSGAIAGVGGWYYAHTRAYLAPDSLNLDISFMVAIALIIGGRRTILGPIVGSVLLVLLRDFVPGETSHGIFYGGGLVLALLLTPEGVMGENWKARFRNLRGRFKKVSPADDPKNQNTSSAKAERK